MNKAETKRAALIMDPDEFKRLLERFGEEAMARATVTGYNMALSDVIKITVPSRIPHTTKEWLLDRFRGLAKKAT